MRLHPHAGFWAALALVALSLAPVCARAAEHVTLRNGFEFDCARREAVEGDRVRLILLSAQTLNRQEGYLEVAADAVVRVDMIPDPTAVAPAAPETKAAVPTEHAQTEPTQAEMHTMLAHAGAQHHIDEDLLASVVKAESGGKTFAISRTGAQGLMQLMPGTASEMGVADAFRPEQNLSGGTAYLDQLLVRYHDNAALALAAYNAGPGAVDRYHGIPPYRETRVYVARVIREFNRRKLQAANQARMAGLQTAALPSTKIAR